MTGASGGADPGAQSEWRWDVALSFAGAQRDYVEQVAAALKAQGVRCFYDADEQIELWGKYLGEELPAIYGEQVAAVVVFVSAEYAARDWTRLERRAALARAVRERREYVLPARFDDTPLPGLLSDMVTVDLRTRTPRQFATMIADKLATLAMADGGGSATGVGLGRPAGVMRAGESDSQRLAGAPKGWLLAEVSDPFALEVHRPVQTVHQQLGLPELPEYVPREHDGELGQVVVAAAGGKSGMAVLVGGSSTGKTRACWEALRLLRDRKPEWRLWHPIDPSRPEAALAGLPTIRPRTVVWLNEAQFYLDTPDGLGERVAAGLRELLRDPARSPVLVLATLWPSFWDVLTNPLLGGGDSHAQARELLAGRDITVPTAFSPAQLHKLSEARDVRLAQAAAGARDAQVIQFLAGVPELLARYRNAPPAAAALIRAAMDARRLRMRPALPRAFLEAAAPGYLTDADWDQLPNDWLGQALAYTAAPCRGVRGPLTPIRPRPSRTTGHPSDTGPVYLLADYLDQQGRSARRNQIPPAVFWAAAGTYADPGDLTMLGDAAYNRGLCRAAAQLHKHATAHGDTAAAFRLVQHMHSLHPTDQSPARWAATQAGLNNPDAVARLLHTLWAAGAREQVTALLARDPAAHTALDHPYAVASLLSELRETGAAQQAIALAGRAAAYASLDNPAAVARLLGELRGAHTRDQLTALADRAAAYASVDNPYDVALLLAVLREAGSGDQLTTLLARDPAAHASLDNPYDAARLLRELREAGATGQVTALADRAAARAPLDHPGAVARLLGELREAGATGQVTVLASRAAARAPLDNPRAVAILLRVLRKTAGDQVTALLARDPAARAALDDPDAIASLLRALREAGAWDQVTALADRAAAHAPLDDPVAVSALRRELWNASAAEQVTALTRRAALENPAAVSSLRRELRKAGTAEQVTALTDRAVAHVLLDNPRAVADLLRALREAGARDQVIALLARDPAAHASLDDPDTVASLLRELREAGAQEQAEALMGRLPGAGMFWLFYRQEGNGERFRFGREPDGSPAEQWRWEDLD